VRLYFPSQNPAKSREIIGMLRPAGIDVIPVPLALCELQTDDLDQLIRDKLLKAFQTIGRPLFVEHTGLYLDALGGFPGGLTQLFWDRVGAKQACSLFGQSVHPGVSARTTIGFCDGRNIHQFDGIVRGRIAPEPIGKHGFGWDDVFIPDGHHETFAQMGVRKDEISMRRIAFDKLIRHFAEASA
jgi:XTP/dITP diphosphohydrolase